MGYLSDAVPRVLRGSLSPGRQGTSETLHMMQRLVNEGSQDPGVRATAIQVIQRANVPPRDFLGELGALFYFVRDAVRFTRDVWDVETLQTAEYTLRTLAGDCDDKSVLLAAMLRSVGNPAELRFRVIATDPHRPEQFTHVYVVAKVGNQVVPLDPSSPSDPGWEYGAPLAVGDLTI